VGRADQQGRKMVAHHPHHARLLLVFVAPKRLADNALVDVEADRASNRATVAVAVGTAAAWRLHALALGAAIVMAVVLLPAGGSTTSLPAIAAGAVGLGVGILLVLARTAIRRRLAWQFEAAGVASIGVGWILAVADRSI